MGTHRCIACAIGALAASWALAAEPDPHAGHRAPAAPAEARAAPADPGQTALPARLAHMRELMDRIHATGDAGERATLMQEHLDAMSAVLAALRGPDAPGTRAAAGAASAQAGTDGMKMKMGMMKKADAGIERRLDAIEAVLDQMIARERAQGR
ncbi:MAG TPA: hypothetical protein VFV71_01050 [Burkholderiales bacterium]|nr:hypothetical protein [Burkholderiales bacterium]